MENAENGVTDSMVTLCRKVPIRYSLVSLVSCVKNKVYYVTVEKIIGLTNL